MIGVLYVATASNLYMLTALQDVVTDALAAYKQATVLDRSWYKAWHAWALANSEVVSHYMKTRPESDTDPVPHAIFTGYLVPSVQGEIDCADYHKESGNLTPSF